MVGIENLHRPVAGMNRLLLRALKHDRGGRTVSGNRVIVHHIIFTCDDNSEVPLTSTDVLDRDLTISKAITAHTVLENRINRNLLLPTGIECSVVRNTIFNGIHNLLIRICRIIFIIPAAEDVIVTRADWRRQLRCGSVMDTVFIKNLLITGVENNQSSINS